MAIKWSERFATGDARIDEQHQQIFRFANRLESLSQQDHADPHEVDSLLRFLETYTQNHFRYEEACMIKRRCPAAMQNRAEHLAFKTFLTRTIETYRENGYQKAWAVALYQRLEKWLNKHICCIDAQLRDHIE